MGRRRVNESHLDAGVVREDNKASADNRNSGVFMKHSQRLAMGLIVKNKKFMWFTCFIVVILTYSALAFYSSMSSKVLSESYVVHPGSVELFVPDLKNVEEFPHYGSPPSSDSAAAVEPFTQGLTVLGYEPEPLGDDANGAAVPPPKSSVVLLESSGLYDASYLRAFDLHTGKTLATLNLPQTYFAEGVCEVKGYIFMLTWREKRMVVFRIADKIFSKMSKLKKEDGEEQLGDLFGSVERPFVLVAEFRVDQEGWGIESDGDNKLWATSGGDELYEYEIPWSSIKEQENVLGEREFAVDDSNSLPLLEAKSIRKMTCFNESLSGVNELEYDRKGHKLWGNLYGPPIVVELNPDSGMCRRMVYFGQLYNPSDNKIKTHIDLGNDVMNGVAFHQNMDELEMLVTGKRWPRIYKIKLQKMSTPQKDDNDSLLNSPERSAHVVSSWKDVRRQISLYYAGVNKH